MVDKKERKVKRKEKKRKEKKRKEKKRKEKKGKERREGVRNELSKKLGNGFWQSKVCGSCAYKCFNCLTTILL